MKKKKRKRGTKPRFDGMKSFFKKEDNTTFQLAKRLCSILCAHVLCVILHLYSMLTYCAVLNQFGQPGYQKQLFFCGIAHPVKCIVLRSSYCSTKSQEKLSI